VEEMEQLADEMEELADEEERLADEEEGRSHRDARKQSKRDKLAMKGRWSKFLPGPAEPPMSVLVDGTSIADSLSSSERKGQKLVLEHVRKSVEMTQLDFKVVFEGHGWAGAGKWAKKAGIDLIFSRHRPALDTLLEHSDGALVVTDERSVALAALDAGASVMKARRFYVLTDTDSEDSSSDSSSASSSDSETSESESDDDDKHRHSGRRHGRHGRSRWAAEPAGDEEKRPRCGHGHCNRRLDDCVKRGGSMRRSDRRPRRTANDGFATYL